MQNPPGGSYPPQQGQQQGGFQQPGGYPPMGPVSGKTQTLGLDYNVAAGLCYIPLCLINPIVPIIWIVTEPKSNKFVRFHAFQALFLAITYIVAIIAVVVVFAILGLALGMASETLAAVIGLVFYHRRPRLRNKLLAMGLPESFAEEWEAAFPGWSA